MKQLHNKSIIVCIALLAMLYIAACKKGEKGEQGAQGIQGVQDIPGKDGSKFYSGQGTPAASTGIVGDYYINNPFLQDC